MVNEFSLVEQKDLREQFIERIDILEKVKGLLLLGNTDHATTQQVADYYEVGLEAIKSIIFRNKDELLEDGIKILEGKEARDFLVSCKLQPTNFRGYFVADGQKFANKSNTIFPRRAILRVGMLLRDSEIAKEVRTQLLNIEEKISVENKISSITEEQQLMLDVMCATSESDKLLAFSRYNDFKNRQINILEDKVDTLVTGILTWNAREGCVRMARKIAHKIFNNDFVKAWDKIYAEMLYKHNIGVRKRILNSGNNKATIFDVINQEEMKSLVKSCLSLCEMYKIDVKELFIDIKQL